MRLFGIIFLVILSASSSVQTKQERGGGLNCPFFDAPAECFKCHDVDGDGEISAAEFESLCGNLLGKSARFNPSKVLSRLLPAADSGKNIHIHTGNRGRDAGAKISQGEFENIVWPRFVSPFLRKESRRAEKCALLVIDVQNDFISGSLAVPEADSVIEPINRLSRSGLFSALVYSQDWHPSNHVSFYSNRHARPTEQNPDELSMFDTATFEGPPRFNQTLWPDHCVQNSDGAKFHPDLDIQIENEERAVIIVQKGTNPEVDSYSAFFDNVKNGSTGLDRRLIDWGVGHVFVAGLATDYCVGSTALDALGISHFGAVFVIVDASRGVMEDTSSAMMESVIEKGGILVKEEELSLTSSSSLAYNHLSQVLLVSTVTFIQFCSIRLN